MTFALGLFIGFFLGILCMTLLFLTKSAEAAIEPPVGKPAAEEKNTPYSVISPSETHSPSSSKD